VYGEYLVHPPVLLANKVVAVSNVAADAVPKKRGPKTDVLEALLKRVDGLEAKLKEKNSAETPDEPSHLPQDDAWQGQRKQDDIVEPPPKRQAVDHDEVSRMNHSINNSSNPSIPMYVPTLALDPEATSKH
jgi:hypothetical protein